MNSYCQSALNQIKIGLNKTIDMLETLEEGDLQTRPTLNKHSIGELFEHIAIICLADLTIANGATEEDMYELYSSNQFKTKSEIKDGILTNFTRLEETYMNYSEEELQQEVTSFWGVTYTKYEWLIEIVAHIYHHRGQLHAILVHHLGKDPGISMFE